MCVMCSLRTTARDEGATTAARIGAFALESYLLGRTGATAMLMDTVHDRFGADGLYSVAVSWCQTVLAWTPGYERGAPVYLVWQDVETGLITHADETPPLVRWAGQMIAACAAEDHQASRALFDAVSGSDEDSARYMGALLKALDLQLQAIGAGGAA